jgi:FkbM family methyltransferase
MNLIFDIGFNRGDFSKICLEHNPNCKIIGVEANAGLYYDFKQTNNVSLLHYVVSDGKEESVDFFIDPSQDGISTASQEFMKNSRFSKGSKYLRENSASWFKVGKIKTITLDKMINEYGNPDLIKIDVEGYEHNVVSGLTQKSGKICFECHEEEEKLEKIINHLLSIGYEQFGMIGFYEEGNSYEKLTYSEHGDPYMVEPENYYSWGELKKDIDKCFQKERRINYGMVWAK